MSEKTADSAYMECPICDWEEMRESAKYEASNLAAAPGIAQAMGIPTAALLSTHMHQAMARDERKLEEHLKTHGPHDWLPVLMDYKRLVKELRDLYPIDVCPKCGREGAVCCV